MTTAVESTRNTCQHCYCQGTTAAASHDVVHHICCKCGDQFGVRAPGWGPWNDDLKPGVTVMD